MALEFKKSVIPLLAVGGIAMVGYVVAGAVETASILLFSLENQKSPGSVEKTSPPQPIGTTAAGVATYSTEDTAPESNTPGSSSSRTGSFPALPATDESQATDAASMLSETETNEDYIRDLQIMVISEPNAVQRVKLIRQLAALDMPSGIDRLGELLYDPDATNRYRGIELLAELGYQAKGIDLDRIADLLNNARFDSNAGIANLASQALGLENDGTGG